jgi:hypothetical protein
VNARRKDFLNAPGQTEIQSDLFYDYRTNVAAYPSWQEWLQRTQPALLVLWGKHDFSFDLGEPDRYRKDVPNAQVHTCFSSHGGELRVRRELGDWFRQILVECIPALLLNFASLRWILVTMTII